MRALLLLAFVLGMFPYSPVQAQLKKIAVIGSSTASGTGAQPEIDSSWVRRLSYYLKYQQSVIDTIYNLALPGYDNYHGLPSSYTPGPGFSTPDPNRNVTRANSFSPDVVIVSFVSNNFNIPGYPTDSIMKAFQIIKDSVNKEGHICFISTTQPRTSFDIPSRARLRVLKDSILNRFGFYAINFFDSIVNNADNSILTDYASPYDNIHLNNAGHAMLFRQVLAKDMFNIRIIRTRKSGDFNDPQTWDRGLLPTLEDSVAVLPGHTLTISGACSVRGISVANGASLQLLSNAASLSIGHAAKSNYNFTVDGTLRISQGLLQVNGRLRQNTGSRFEMSGGALVIDGNNENASSSVADGLALFDIDAAVNSFQFTGGTLQIIDPPLGANSQALSCSFDFGPNTVLHLGNGISTTISNNENGFGGNLMPAKIGKLVLDTGNEWPSRKFINLQPLTIHSAIEIISGQLVQAAALTIEN